VSVEEVSISVMDIANIFLVYGGDTVGEAEIVMVAVKIGARRYQIPTVALVPNSTQPVLTRRFNA